jgi:hypothetical protein
MANIPPDLQRRFEQRWAAKFFFRPDPNAPKTQELKTQAAAGEGKRRTRGLGGRVSSLHQRCERETDEVPRSAKKG